MRLARRFDIWLSFEYHTDWSTSCGPLVTRGSQEEREGSLAKRGTGYLGGHRTSPVPAHKVKHELVVKEDRPTEAT